MKTELQRQRVSDRRRESGQLKIVAVSMERSKRLHNFSFPYLKWGSQRFLRCVKITPDSNPPDHRSSTPQLDPLEFGVKSASFGTANQISELKVCANHNDCENNIEDVLDLKVAANKLKVSTTNGGGEAESAATRPWNLRTRRAACNAPQEEKRKNELGSSPVMKDKGKEKEKEGPKFSVPLSKEEIEEDFVAMVGIRPPRRPKKRPRIVQKQLDTLFPGLWLTDVTPESYEVADVPES